MSQEFKIANWVKLNFRRKFLRELKDAHFGQDTRDFYFLRFFFPATISVNKVVK